MVKLKPCTAELIHVLYDFACGWVVCMAELKLSLVKLKPCTAELIQVLYDFACGWVVCMGELKT